jgi:hypothetical protein
LSCGIYACKWDSRRLSPPGANVRTFCWQFETMDFLDGFEDYKKMERSYFTLMSKHFLAWMLD